MLTDTEDVYTKECGRQAETFLRFIKTAAEASGLVSKEYTYFTIILTLQLSIPRTKKLAT